jgi:1,4-alpha-glucan branching enzyme
VAEDVSGMPGLGAPVDDGGLGFDFKLAMGIPDFWFKLLKEKRDEDWNCEEVYRELTNRRHDEKTISYVECHDQAIVGGKSLIFELIDADMYTSMASDAENIRVDRGIALHKIIRLLTLATAGHGYLNFIGNEFGHPEWVDFPREGNNWSYKYARRQWSLRDNPELKYHGLAEFDKIMIHTADDYKIFDYEPVLVHSHVDNHVLAFARGNLLFVFNLHPECSFREYLIDMNDSYELVFDSDNALYAGFNRLVPEQKYFPVDYENRRGILLYLPARTALCLRRTDI